MCPECGLKGPMERCPEDGRTMVLAERLRPSTDPYMLLTIDGKYRLESRIGKGGFGSVYRAVHVVTGGQVAVKVLRSDFMYDEGIVRRFYIEAQNTHRLHHPNTVRVSDFGKLASGELYLVMEFVQGDPLSVHLRRSRRFAEARAVRIVEQVLKSLGEAHGHGIIHRDIKPENIMLTDTFGETDFVKLLDFGISRALDTSGAMTIGSIGTPRYMAPEQWAGQDPTQRTDLYAVGCILYELLAGRAPFEFDGPGDRQQNALRFMNAHTEQPTPDLLAAAPGVCCADLATLTMQLLEKDPALRPTNAREVLKRLEEIRRRNVLASTPRPIGQEPIGQTQGAAAPDPSLRISPTALIADLHAVYSAAPATTQPPPMVSRAPSWRRPAIVAALVTTGAVVMVIAFGRLHPVPGPPEISLQPAPPVIAEPPPATLIARPPPAARIVEPPPQTPATAPATVAELPRPTPVLEPGRVTLLVPKGATVRDMKGQQLESPATISAPAERAKVRVVTVSQQGFRTQRVRLDFPPDGETRQQVVVLIPTARVTFNLRPRSARVRVRTPTPLDLDRGVTQWAVPDELADGPLKLVISAPGHRTVTRLITLQELKDGPVTVNATLKRTKQGYKPKPGYDI